MLRIGEAAKQFDVSSRTLRYWEESGILKSTRMENGYRFYDDINSARIRQIVLLRKLRIPISEIARIFIAADCGVTIDALTEKKFNGGLYASISTTTSEIGERWKLLDNWCRESEQYDVDASSQWLEACSMDFEMFISEQILDSEKRLDLLEPIKMK